MQNFKTQTLYSKTHTEIFVNLILEFYTYNSTATKPINYMNNNIGNNFGYNLDREKGDQPCARTVVTCVF